MLVDNKAGAGGNIAAQHLAAELARTMERESEKRGRVVREAKITAV